MCVSEGFIVVGAGGSATDPSFIIPLSRSNWEQSSLPLHYDEDDDDDVDVDDDLCAARLGQRHTETR